MTDTNITSYQAADMLQCSIKTIGKMVNTFKEFFSDSAAQNAKGRLYTWRELETLATIQRGRKARLKDEQITALLRDGELVNLKKEFSDQDVLTFAKRAAETLDQAQEILGNYQELTTRQQRAMGSMANKINALENGTENLHRLFSKLNSWQVQMQKHFAEFRFDHEDAWQAEAELHAEQAALDTPPAKPRQQESNPMRGYIIWGVIILFIFLCLIVSGTFVYNWFFAR